MCNNVVREIACLIGTDGSTVPLSKPGSVAVYRRDRGAWLKDREMPFTLDPARGLAEMRSSSAELLRFMGPCRIFVSRSASGALFFELEKAKVNVYEVAGTPAEFLEQVWSEDEQEDEAETVPPVAPMPVPLEQSPGNYYISIKEVQRCRPDLSSKKVLQAFIRRGGFATIEIDCDHVPPWIEMEKERAGFTMDAEQIERGLVRVRLVKTAS
jgi:Fe-only nitrogenase accessory protein AnfO